MESIKIFVDRLKNGQTLGIDEVLSPLFLEIDEKELFFKESVFVKGKAYLVDDHLLIQLSINTEALLPCSVCNELTKFVIGIKNFNITILLADIRGAIYDCTDSIREAILLQVPLFTECGEGICAERENIQKFLKIEKKVPSSDSKTFPFADLTLKKSSS